MNEAEFEFDHGSCRRLHAQPGRPAVLDGPSGKLVYTRSSEVLISIPQIAVEGTTPKAHTFRYHRANLGQYKYPPVPLYIPLMGGSSLSLECILLPHKGTKRMEPG